MLGWTIICNTVLIFLFYIKLDDLAKSNQIRRFKPFYYQVLPSMMPCFLQNQDSSRKCNDACLLLLIINEFVSINSFRVLTIPSFHHAYHFQEIINKCKNYFVLSSFLSFFLYYVPAMFTDKYNQTQYTNTRAWCQFCQYRVSMVS